MRSIWQFIDEPKHFGAKGSAAKDFLYGLDRNEATNWRRLQKRLEEIRVSRKRGANKVSTEEDLLSKEKDLLEKELYGTDRNKATNWRRLEDIRKRLEEIQRQTDKASMEEDLLSMEKDLLEKELGVLDESTNTEETVLHAFLEIGKVPLGRANRFDRFIWDLYLRTGTKHFQVLTMFTNDIQANYFLLWKDSPFRLVQFFCSFLQVGPRTIQSRDENFMLKAGALGDPAALFGKKKSDARKILDKARKKDISTLLNWNQFSVDPTCSSATCIRFKRRFLMLDHSCRKYFQNVPLITRSLLDPRNVSTLFSSFEETANFYRCLNSATAFYDALGRQKSWVAGVGAPMRQNLDQLGSAMSNYQASAASVTLVTGLPGTGKENYMDALHFAGTSCDRAVESRLVKTTALEMENYSRGVAACFKNKCRPFSEPITFVIDEFPWRRTYFLQTSPRSAWMPTVVRGSPPQSARPALPPALPRWLSRIIGALRAPLPIAVCFCVRVWSRRSCQIPQPTCRRPTSMDSRPAANRSCGCAV